jgi:hypothetical protein
MSFLASIIVIAIVGFLVWRGGRDQRVGTIKPAHWLRIVGLIPLGMQVLIFLLFGFGEMFSGDISGAGHLLQALVVAPLGFLAWMRPLEGGIALFIVGLVTYLSFPESALLSSEILILAAPQVVSGVLFFIAGILSRGTTIPMMDQDK